METLSLIFFFFFFFYKFFFFFFFFFFFLKNILKKILFFFYFFMETFSLFFFFFFFGIILFTTLGMIHIVKYSVNKHLILRASYTTKRRKNVCPDGQVWNLTLMQGFPSISLK